jgi:hypothetical protein
LLPASPEAIPVHPQLRIAAPGTPIEREADQAAASATGGGPEPDRTSPIARKAPPIVHDALDSPGQALDLEARSAMQSRLGSDFGQVRIHTDSRAKAAANAIQARAFTVGQDIFFGAEGYNPDTEDGLCLLSHEISHTIQQSGGGRAGLSAVAPTVQRYPVPTNTATAQGTTVDTQTKKPKTQQVTVHVPPALLQHYQLTLPPLVAPQRPSYGPPTHLSLDGFAPAGGAPSAAQTPSQVPPLAPALPPAYQYTPPTPNSPFSSPAPNVPAASPRSGAAGTTASKAPDRLSLHDFGNFSIGARINFPDLSKDTDPGAPPSAVQEAVKKGEILNFIINGQPPSEYSVDAGKLVSAVWGIFSTQIDPSVAAKIASAMASKPTGAGPTYQLDVTILYGSVNGQTSAGATLSVSF